jgi:hypothetical protein
VNYEVTAHAPTPKRTKAQTAFYCGYKRDLVGILNEIYNDNLDRINLGCVAVTRLMLEIQYMV